MSTSRPLPVSVPPEMRSALPGRPGIPWWGAVLAAVGASLLGFLVDWARVGDELTFVFSTFYYLGCVGAVVAVRQRSLFTAMVQPPLILFFGMPLGYLVMSIGEGAGLRSQLFDLVVPLVTNFPLMLFATATVLIIGGARYLMASQARAQSPRGGRPRQPAQRQPAQRQPAQRQPAQRQPAQRPPAPGAGAPPRRSSVPPAGRTQAPRRPYQ